MGGWVVVVAGFLYPLPINSVMEREEREVAHPPFPTSPLSLSSLPCPHLGRSVIHLFAFCVYTLKHFTVQKPNHSAAWALCAHTFFRAAPPAMYGNLNAFRIHTTSNDDDVYFLRLALRTAHAQRACLCKNFSCVYSMYVCGE